MKFGCFAQKQKTMILEVFSFFFKADFNATDREHFLFTRTEQVVF
ncbi:Hypothetical protein Ccan_10490 [Capnocytophaga canimorsus Cc5]|uniref:Uncharacterized protein n=1 Tax=Capnocytophaga canimorsus (strain 5) TaxID=860228 RepID=F9YVC0_CAPCC|nr:Hypothetical protein Ccan_10490 [Capnocytophaga canimorsus Cc5]